MSDPEVFVTGGGLAVPPMSRRCDVLSDGSTNLDKAGVGYLAERLAPTGKQTLLVIHRDELVAAMPQPIVVERASVPGYWSCFGACSSAWSGRSCVDSLTATSSGCGHRTYYGAGAGGARLPGATGTARRVEAPEWAAHPPHSPPAQPAAARDDTAAGVEPGCAVAVASRQEQQRCQVHAPPSQWTKSGRLVSSVQIVVCRVAAPGRRSSRRRRPR
ncbi:MAG: hypothetical protein QOH62_3245 [Solirubrobacteraceae bacterium]|jgi:hypothetical protein|nr:hypothetical protein [Solirubrobacteraceae bacterium]